MTDNTTATTEPETADAMPAPDLGDAGKRALDAERAARKTAEDERKQLAAKLKQLEDRDKTETQRQAERLTQLEQENTRLKLATLRSEIAATKNVPSELLQGNTSEEITASADALLAFAESRNTATPNRFIVPLEQQPQTALNGDGIETALRNALGA